MTTAPVPVTKPEVLPPPPFSTYRLSFNLATISASADGVGACCATAIDSVPTTSSEPRMMRRFMLCLRIGGLYPAPVGRSFTVRAGRAVKGSPHGFRRHSLVIFPVHTPPEHPAAERPEPAEHVIHVAKVHQLDDVAVEVPCKEERVPPRRALRPADAFHPFAHQVVVPPLQVADVEGDVRQSDLVPWHGRRRQLRTELEDFEHAAAGNANPADLARRIDAADQRRHRPHAEERAHALGRGIGDADERTAEHLPVELHRTVEVRDRDADVAERPRSHVSPLPGPKGPGLR